MTAVISATQFRDGAWHESTGHEVSETTNPATGATISTYLSASSADLDRALDSLRAAYPSWKRTPLAARQSMLGRIADEVLVDKERIADQMTREMGKTLRESLIEVEIFASTCRWYQHEAGRAIGSVLPSADGSRMIHTRRKPMGVVACITPWNFPIVLAGYKIFAALAVGNVVLWKPAQQINGTAMLVAEAFERAGVGAEFCLLGAATGQLASQAVVDARVDAVSFTGSTQVGIQIAQALAPRLAPSSLELGGKNAAIVLADADLDHAAEHIVRSAFLTSGQRCTATSRLIVDNAVAEPLLERVISRMEKLVVGDGFDPEVDLGPLATRAQLANVEKAVEQALTDGAVLRAGGTRPDHLPTEGNFYSPTLLDNVEVSMSVATDEIFGPVIAVLRVDSADEAFEIANGTDYGLSTSVFTRNLSEAHRSMDALDSGLIYINRGTSAAELGVPFGGTGLSGNGHREVSAHGFEFMTELVSIYVDPGNGG